MRAVKLTLAYEGTGFVGWQRQAAGPSIQSLVEEAIAPFVSEGHANVIGAGRTDAGVHALAQAASAHIVTQTSTAVLQRALNARLPPAVRVTEIEDVAPDFHARFSATAKRYAYHIVNGPLISPFEVRYAWHVSRALDVDRMRRASVAIVGRHDFAAFQATGSHARDTHRTILETRLELTGEHLTFVCRGDGFLRHMVRSLTGTLVEIGQGRFEPGRLAELLARPDRTRVGPTAPAHGLFLVGVEYDDDGAAEAGQVGG